MTLLSAAKLELLVAALFVAAAGALALFPGAFPGRGMEATIAWRVQAPSTDQDVDLEAYRWAVRGEPVLVDALQRMGVDDPRPGRIERLRSRTDLQLDPEAPRGPMIRLHTYSGSVRGARERAEAVASSLENWDRQRLGARIDELDRQVRILQVSGTTEAEAEIDALVAERAMWASAVDQGGGLLARDGAMTRQVSPWTVRNAVFVALFAAVFSAGLLLRRQPTRPQSKRKARSSPSNETQSAFRVLGSVPYAMSRAEAGLRDAIAPLARKVMGRTQRLAVVGSPSLLVTSASGEEGKTTVASLLAEELTRTGYRVLLVDGNIAAPALARHYRVDGGGGGEHSDVPTTLAWLQRPDREVQFARVPLEGDLAFDLVPQFRPARPAPGVAEELFRDFRSALRRWEDYDLILIDGAPLLPDQDAFLMAPHVDGMLLVVDRHRTRRTQLMHAEQAVKDVGCEVFGLVVNDTLGAKGPEASWDVPARVDAQEKPIAQGVKVRNIE